MLQSGASFSAASGRNGVVPNLLHRRRRSMTEGGAATVQADDGLTGAAEVRRMEERVRKMEGLLGLNTLEVEILTEALGKVRATKPTWRARSPITHVSGRRPWLTRSKVVARPLSDARSSGRYRKDHDGAPLKCLRRLIDGRPSQGDPAGRQAIAGHSQRGAA